MSKVFNSDVPKYEDDDNDVKPNGVNAYNNVNNIEPNDANNNKDANDNDDTDNDVHDDEEEEYILMENAGVYEVVPIEVIYASCGRRY